MRKYLIWGGPLLVVLLVWLGWSQFFGGNKAEAKFQLAKLEKRDLVKSVSATGTLSAVITVEVGSQVSGQIAELLADFNSPVKKDQIIAKIDQASYRALVQESQADLSLAQAQLLTKKATVEKTRAELASARSKVTAAQAQTTEARATMDNAKREVDRRKSLVAKDFISKADYDTAVTTYDRAKAAMAQFAAQVQAAQAAVASAQAGLAIAEAQVREAEAQVELKQATLDKRSVDLEHTIIRSPVEGVVIDRSVDTGQTVAASLQAPILFKIAQDLKKMQVSTSVDEADIGSLREGQTADFTVDAYGSRKFVGSVTQIRKAGQSVQNVVTYTVIISADNPDLALMPGMTANVDIVVARKMGVLSAPNAALRFRPQAGEGSGGGAAGAPGGGPGGANLRERLTRLADALKMTPDQRARLEAGAQQLREKIFGRQQNGAVPFRTGELADQMRQQLHNLIVSLLTPEQRDRYEILARGRELSQEKPGELWRLGPDGRPEALKVRVGVTDGSFSEVRGQGLEPGQEVIVGLQ
ncbi:MAG: efflux RND transporter periplasmic adaptor subunit [Deltaproteobacteria bacterium]|nr:efflux RND transporter periplasmic adaptor subunit [Deltaproteobacteria bacterium]